MNISGTWSYREDFEFGKSEGKVIITQNGDVVEAIFAFIERVENSYEIAVTETTMGTISDNKVLLESVEVKAIQDGKEIEYLSNSFDLYLVSEDKLVGSTFDSEGVCGVFVMEK